MLYDISNDMHLNGDADRERPMRQAFSGSFGSKNISEGVRRAALVEKKGYYVPDE